MLDKLNPKLIAVLAFPAMMIVSLPFAYITGTFSIVIVDQFLNPVNHPSSDIGYLVGPTVGILFAFAATYGIFKLANEVREEPGAESVSA